MRAWLAVSGTPRGSDGDFNIRNAPDRYYFQALERPYTVVGEFCAQAGSGCGPGAPDATSEPWLKSQDLQAFRDGVVRVRPVRADVLFLSVPAVPLVGDIVRYSLLPMMHAVLNDLLTPEQARAHVDLISRHLVGPDGARLFDRPLPAEPEDLRQLPDYRDESVPLAERARSYLHANCAQCHVEAGGAVSVSGRSIGC